MFLKPETRTALEPVFTLTSAHAWDFNQDKDDKWWFAHDLIEEVTSLTVTDALVEYVERTFENLLDTEFEASK